MENITAELGIYTLSSDIKRIYIDKSDMKRKRAIDKELKHHAMAICRRKISERYISSALNNYTNGYIYVKGKDIIGFALWKIFTDAIPSHASQETEIKRHIYVTLICSEHKEYSLGRAISRDIDRFCIKNNFYAIVIEPADSVLETYYQRAGYIKGRVVNIPLYFENQMTKLVSTSTLSKTRRARRKNNNTRKMNLTEDMLTEEYENVTQYNELLEG